MPALTSYFSVPVPPPPPAPGEYSATRHSADYKGDFKIDADEFARFRSLYEVQNAGARTGCYQVDPTSIDGFAPAPARSAATVVTLTHYHSADTDRDGKISYEEFYRVVELYNYGENGVRRGYYHAQPGTVDGFTTGHAELTGTQANRRTSTLSAGRVHEYNPILHSADYDGDNRIGPEEFNRVIELYNTRVGTTRTGAYRVDPTSIDGFAPDVRPLAAVVTLEHYHSADTNRDGKISLFELTRVIELYNYRTGPLRTGIYHYQTGTEDNFATGPATTSGRVGTPFVFQVTANNSPTRFYAFSLPAWLSLNAATGLLTGTPTAAGEYTFTVAAGNGSGALSQKLTFTIAV